MTVTGPSDPAACLHGMHSKFHGGEHTICHDADETCSACDESRGADPLPSSEDLRQHIEAARAQAFAEVAQVVNARYRHAFDEFGQISVAVGTTGDTEARRLFWVMDTWCLALRLVKDVGRLPGATARPEIVVLCGSTRFKDAFREAAKAEALTGRIVLTVSDLDLRPEMRHVNVPIDADTKARLDELHKRKIDLADRVLVLNVGGYIGESTRSEIEYATAHGKPITYLEVPAAPRPGRTVTPYRKNADGSTTIKVQRCCNGCGKPIGDVTLAEIDCAISGAPLPDVRSECPRCSVADGSTS